MRVALFCHTLRSDWNHGNAHFLRGVVTELVARGHDVRVFEPEDAWSAKNLVEEKGEEALRGYRRVYPQLSIRTYRLEDLDVGAALEDVDLCIVHEWNDPALVKRIGAYRKHRPSLRVLFHDTHHRSVTAPEEMARYDLSAYDGALCFGEIIRSIYLEKGWIGRAWTWHEAADVRVFRPYPEEQKTGDVVWIGNWGDDERTAELKSFLLEPVARLSLFGRVYGVRYPEEGKRMVAAAGLSYGGWLPNYEAPKVYAQHRVTVHVPRRAYVEALPGIPTIRPFEAMACGIPLITAPWDDAENLFRPGLDYLVAKSGRDMERHLRNVLNDPTLRRALSACGRQTILERHTCAHRVDELQDVCRELGLRVDDEVRPNSPFGAA